MGLVVCYFVFRFANVSLASPFSIWFVLYYKDVVVETGGGANRARLPLGCWSPTYSIIIRDQGPVRCLGAT